MHVRSAEDAEKPCCGVKRRCVLSAHLSHFNVSTGYPPDSAHDLFEGILPVELAHCLNVLISKGFLTLNSLNEIIHKYLGRQKKQPHAVPRLFMSNKSIGGNAHENGGSRFGWTTSILFWTVGTSR